MIKIALETLIIIGVILAIMGALRASEPPPAPPAPKPAFDVKMTEEDGIYINELCQLVMSSLQISMVQKVHAGEYCLVLLDRINGGKKK